MNNSGDVNISGSRNSVNVNSGNRITNNYGNRGGGSDPGNEAIGALLSVGASLFGVVAGYIYYIDYIVRIAYWAAGVTGVIASGIALYRWWCGRIEGSAALLTIILALGNAIATVFIMDNAVLAIAPDAKQIIATHRLGFFRHMSKAYLYWTAFQIVGVLALGTSLFAQVAIAVRSVSAAGALVGSAMCGASVAAAYLLTDGMIWRWLN